MGELEGKAPADDSARADTPQQTDENPENDVRQRAMQRRAMQRRGAKQQAATQATATQPAAAAQPEVDVADSNTDAADATVKAIRSTDWEELDRLSRHDTPEVRRAVAANPKTYKETLYRLAGDDDDDVRIEIAKCNNWIAAEMVSGDRVVAVRAAVASNPRMLKEYLVKLSRDPAPEVVRALAGNPSTPQSILTNLSTSKDDPTRAGVAGNTATEMNTVHGMANDVDPKVRAAVAERATDDLVRGGLLNDREVVVREALVGNPAMTSGELLALAKDRATSVLLKLATRDPRPDHDVIQQLIVTPVMEVHVKLAERQDAEPDMLDALAGDPAWQVRVAVAQNCKTSDGAMKALEQDPHFLVRKFANLRTCPTP